MFSLFVTNANVKEPQEMPVITFNLSDQFVFLFVGLQLATVHSDFLKGDKYEGQQAHIIQMRATNLQ